MNQTNRPTNKEAEDILNLYFPVLDHGFVALKDYMGTDKCIENAARVSYSGGGTRKINQTEGLIRYLRRHLHSSPSELLQLKFHICAPIFVLRQFFRHRTLSANEMSGRYSLLPMVFYTPTENNFKKQASSNKQGRDEKIDVQKHKAAVSRWNKLREKSVELYTDLAAEDVARELARIDLPLSTYSQLYFSINLHNLFHFMNLRSDNHAQFEIQEYSNTFGGIVKKVAPLSYKAWIDYNFCGTNFSRMEMNLIRDILDISMNDKTASVICKKHSALIGSNNSDLSTRELAEFVDKFKPVNVPDHELNLSKAKNPEFFEKIMNDAVPLIDKDKF